MFQILVSIVIFQATYQYIDLTTVLSLHIPDFQTIWKLEYLLWMNKTSSS